MNTNEKSLDLAQKKITGTPKSLHLLYSTRLNQKSLLLMNSHQP